MPTIILRAGDQRSGRPRAVTDQSYERIVGVHSAIAREYMLNVPAGSIHSETRLIESSSSLSDLNDKPLILL
jgi:hypothetical protein